MTSNEYQSAALRTANTDYGAILDRLTDGGEPILRLLNGALGLAGESGEVADIIKKHIFHGHPLDETHIIKELGDICWYLAITAAALDYPLEEVMKVNVTKLEARYTDGFDRERSLYRSAGDV